MTAVIGKGRRGHRLSVKAHRSPVTSFSVTDHRLLDLRGVLCPMNYLRARMTLEAAEPHSLFEFLLDDEEEILDVSKSLREDGYSILSSEMKDGVCHLVVES